MGRQRDLLTMLEPNSDLAPQMREALIPMMAALLLEAAAEPANDAATGAADREVANDQDRG